jgi:hypothetical protein
MNFASRLPAPLMNALHSIIVAVMIQFESCSPRRGRAARDLQFSPPGENKFLQDPAS